MFPRVALLLPLLLLTPAVFAACSGESPSGGEHESEDELISPDPSQAPRATEELRFEAACAGDKSVTIGGFGDVLMHEPLQVQAYRSDIGFRSTWKGAESLLKKADLTYANLEGPTAPGLRASGAAAPDPGKRFDKVVYTSYPQFNYHPSLIDDLLASGVDVVSTANNHSLDRQGAGTDKTLDELDARHLPHTGTRRGGSSEAWHTVTEAKGIRVAWLACTFSTNGINDRKGQVLRCFDGEQAPGAKPNAELLQVIKDLAARPDIDAVMVTPHWGNEYEYKPRDFQVKAARAYLDAGATAVLGGHPHVIQPWEKYKTADGREGFILYSFGNFASGQLSSNGGPLLAQRTSLGLFLGLSKSAGKKAWVNGVKYTPLFMESNGSIFARVPSANEAPGSLAARSRELSTRVFGEWNRIEEDAPLKTNSQCP